ncbi:HK97 gp10 family phage protein [Kerstersia gyiorum]|uniref:HK97 gp10 family phage protein n=1 Tax=Kerstersia gyiorum TaxID=206506 RepID=UPI00214FF762|nr:HK97 gp10 family phage protein [Kerstersia gyiorum]MCR4158820.1 HK97 gp10 family phage protein [Kerstersia gyiorum]
MVDVKLDVDFSEAIERLDGLAEAAKQHLPRSMMVAAGTVLRDEAKARAPVFDGSTALKGGSNVTKPPQPGLLQEAIYLAYSDKRSVPSAGIASYSVTWNARKAPHGHLLEFGHWRYNVIQGGYPKKSNLESPQWVAAVPFLRPAYDAKIGVALQAGMDRGRERLAEITANPALLDQYK